MIDLKDWEGIKTNLSPGDALMLITKLKVCGVKFSPRAASEAINYLGSSKIVERIKNDVVLKEGR